MKKTNLDSLDFAVAAATINETFCAKIQKKSLCGTLERQLLMFAVVMLKANFKTTDVGGFNLRQIQWLHRSRFLVPVLRKDEIVALDNVMQWSSSKHYSIIAILNISCWSNSYLSMGRFQKLLTTCKGIPKQQLFSCTCTSPIPLSSI